MEAQPITAVIVGAGHRSVTYAEYSLTHPDELKIVGVADPNPERQRMMSERFGFGKDRCYSSAAELASVPKFADAVINGTMDHQHFETAVPLLEKGYDMLLEKPFAVSKDEMEKLIDVVKKNGSRVMICHVLRYSPFYLEIKKRVSQGLIGDIININMVENVSYHHLTTAYVRGKWANSDECKTSMLLAKSCHDIDIMMWMMQPVRPVSVSSAGAKQQFVPENAPEGAAERCSDCRYRDTCVHSSKRIYLEHPDRWTVYVWADFETIENPTDSDRLKSFSDGNPYDRCVYKCNNNVVDHQSVLVNFSNGATGTHNMTGGTAYSRRTIHITGTKGEIEGVFEENRFNVSYINPTPDCGYTQETVDLSEAGAEGHGGGDDALTADFINYLKTGKQSISCTAIENSVAGHLTVFLADESRENGGEVRKIEF